MATSYFPTHERICHEICNRQSAIWNINAKFYLAIFDIDNRYSNCESDVPNWRSAVADLISFEAASGPYGCRQYATQFLVFRDNTAGWLVFTSLRDGHGVTVVGASADLDGMCRPNQYQDFVFVDGKFAGTLSPILMGARSDGGAVKISFPGLSKILVEFDRYTARDPLCCPSRISEAIYEVRKEAGQPVVILTSVRTRPA